jgi:GYF domain 2
MKKYFLHDGTEPSGPFDFEELKAQRITKKNPVWFEGMDNWKYAGELAELSPLFVVLPPPIASFEAAPPPIQAERTVRTRKILGLSKNTFWIGSAILVLLVFTYFFNTLQEERSRELKQKNYKTEVENRKYELQQKEIEKQKIIEADAEKAAAERLNKEKKQTFDNRILEIQKTIEDYKVNIEVTEKKLEKAAGFKVLRTATEKKEQMTVLQNEITKCKSEIELLQKESNQLKLELEKIK